VINRRYIECSTCGARAMTRTAIGHSDWQEFAFPCPKCGVEIRFGMKLDQQKPDFTYDFLNGANWLDDGTNHEVQHIQYLDGENLIPKDMRGGFSPFLATSMLLKDPIEFLKERDLRFFASQQIWPKLKQLRIHIDRKSEGLFDKLAREFGYDEKLLTWRDRLAAELMLLLRYGLLFRPFTSAEEAFIYQRINLAESIIGRNLPDLIRDLNDAYGHEMLAAEYERIRDAFAHVYPSVSAVYQPLYWPGGKYSVDDYSLAEKRFRDLKPLYIDCFETFCRVSVIAAAIEGVIRCGSVVIPTRKGQMTVPEFYATNNGSKPAVRKNLPLAYIFVPFIDHKLRNGIGHNSAAYDVKTDTVSYSNRSAKGITNHRLSYIRFCETVVLLYRQLELVYIYLFWLRGRTISNDSVVP
jgi:hypothetical protein